MAAAETSAATARRQGRQRRPILQTVPFPRDADAGDGYSVLYDLDRERLAELGPELLGFIGR